MIVRFTWQPEEWREAYLLATTRPSRAGAISMGYLIVGVMALGGIGDAVHAARSGGRGTLHGSLLPVLLGGFALCALIALGIWMRGRKRRYRNLPCIPPGEQQFVMHERGWNTGSGQAPDAPVHAWSELRGQRLGRHVLALLTRDGNIMGVPLRAMTPEQVDWIQRMVVRKVSHSA